MRNLQSPSLHSIYQNALPYYLDRLDLFAAAEEGEAFAASFLNDLLAGKLAMQINVSPVAAEKLRHLYFQTRNLEKSHGAKTFGFGYPLLIDSYEGELFVAPLFIWLLSLEPAQTKVDSWVLKFSEEQDLVPNYRLHRFLKEKYDLHLLEKAESLAWERKLNRPILDAFCEELAGRLHIENFPPEKTSSPTLVAAPGIDQIGAFTEKGGLHWSGVLGVFPQQFNRWKPGKHKPEDVFVPENTPPGEQPPFTFPMLAPTPEQQNALETVAKNKLTVILGENTGERTNVICNLIINALSEGQKCLVVSERAPALKQTQHFLARAGLNQLHFLLDDAMNDKMPLVELLRTAGTGTGKYIEHSEQQFQLNKNKYLREKAKVDAACNAVKKKVFGDYDWTETVGLFLAANRIEGKELLASQLNSQDFNYTAAEYEALKQGILSSHPLFQRVKTLSHPLGNLHEDIFLMYPSGEGLRFMKQQLKHFTEKTAQLHHRYISKADAYAARLKAHYEQYFEQLAMQATRLREKMAAYSDTLGSSYRNAGSGGLHLPIFLSSTRRKVKQAQEDVSRDYVEMVKDFAERQYFDFQFVPCKNGMNTQKTKANVEGFESALRNWHSSLDTQVQEEMLRLNSKTVHPDLDSKEQISDLEYSLDVLLEEINEGKLYQKPFENKTLTIPQRQKYLESLSEQLETTQLNLRDFEVFHQWQSNWLKLSPLGQKVIRALVKVKPTDWMAAFESWYFNNLLSREQDAALPTDELVVETATDAWHSLKPLVLNQILHRWQAKQVQELKELKRKSKKDYSLIFEKTGLRRGATSAAIEVPLERIFENSFDAVSAFLPVFFVTPHVALNVLPTSAEGGYFDYVIFDEANRFSVEMASSIATLGKKTVIFGSNDGNGNETSLIQYAQESGIPVAHLPTTPTVSAELFSGNHQEELQELAARFSVENVEGRFHELEETNDVEAQHIIRLLNQIKQTPQRVYPSVGIVAMTLEQRDLIAYYLLKLKQQNAFGSEKIMQLERNGMTVCQLDELFGQQFDILIVSCTYGMVNLKGSLSKKIAFLNTPEGISQMRLLTKMPFQKIFLVHSLSDDHLEKFRSKRHEEGTWLLAHLIQFAESTSSGNGEKLQNSMEALGKFSTGKPAKSVFAQEVANALRPYVEEGRFVRNATFAGLPVPLSLKSNAADQPPIILHADGFFAKTGCTASVWESQQRGKIVQAGLSYLPVWSVNWFKNPAQEARWLASKIIKLDTRSKARQQEEVAIQR